MKSIDVLLLCALKDEYEQVLNVTDGLNSEGWIKHNDLTGRLVADGIFSTTQNSEIKIRTTWQPYMGRDEAQALASTIIKSTPMKCIAMSGICAGRRGKVELGDVIFAERLWSYDAGKTVIENGKQVFQGDMLQYRPDKVWVQQMQALDASEFISSNWMDGRPQKPYEIQELWVLETINNNKIPAAQPNFSIECPDWPDVIKRLWMRNLLVDKTLELTNEGISYLAQTQLLYPNGLPPLQEFQVHIAPLATGASVQEDDQIFERLSSSMRKVLGIDMEGSGLAALGESHQIPVIIAKGVSDFGDRFKDDRYRQFSARSAAEALISFLRKNSHLYSMDATATHTSNKAVDALNEVLPRDLLETFADLYYDQSHIRAVWERAGGKAREVENISKPLDLWQQLWKRCNQGTRVTPKSLLEAMGNEYPENEIIQKYLAVE